MMNNISISLESSLARFVQGQIAEGRYRNANDVVVAGLQLLASEDRRKVALKNAIQEGLDSGVAYGFDPAKNLQKLKAEKGMDV